MSIKGIRYSLLKNMERLNKKIAFFCYKKMGGVYFKFVRPSFYARKTWINGISFEKILMEKLVNKKKFF